LLKSPDCPFQATLKASKAPWVTLITTPPWTRRAVLTGAGALSLFLSACERKEGSSPAPRVKMALEEAVAGAWRPDADKARDAWRHPVESLRFWGLQPGMTVVELWPGAGWYTDIIAPFLAANGGRLYAAQFQADDPNEPAARQVAEAYIRKIEANRRLYGAVEFTAFGPTSIAIAPPGSADLVLFLRNVHNWMAVGIAEKAFAEAYAALKPGGVLGIEEHRADPGGVQDVLAADGYVQEAYVRQLAIEAGFVVDGASNINANPNDSRDHPFGVWTLPPTRLTAPRGQPPQPDFDRTAFDAIGESDRMTLRFKKPAV
jgi:predicted methyltransferase